MSSRDNHQTALALQLGKISSAAALDAGAVVHCTAGSSSMSRRKERIAQAVCKPVSSGARHCVNVLKELLPREVIHEINHQVVSGVQPRQAVEKALQQRMGAQAAADLTKLAVSVSLASSAGGGLVRATKSLLCVVARPLFLRGPVRLVTNVLLPTPVAGSLLGCCLVLHTAWELLRSDEQQPQQATPAATAGKASTAASVVVSTAQATDQQGGTAADGQVKSTTGPWWAFWRGRVQQGRKRQEADDGDKLQSSAAAATGAAPAGGDSQALQYEQQAGSAAQAVTCAAGNAAVVKLAKAAPAAAEPVGAADASPVGPVTPDVAGVLRSLDAAASRDPAAAGDAALAAVSVGAFSAKGRSSAAAAEATETTDAGASASPFEQSQQLQQQGVAKGTAGCVPAVPHSLGASAGQSMMTHPLIGSTLLDLDSCSGSEDEGDDNPAVLSSMQDNQHGCNTGTHSAALPLNPISSDAASAETAAAAAVVDTAAGLAPASPVAHQLLRRQRSCSYGYASGDLGSVSGSEVMLSPTSSGPQSPREEIEGQAAEVHRRWSMGHHNEMIPEVRSFQVLQQQPYRPPVFTRLSSGRGGCRITAAAAAASAREQHAARQQQQQRAAKAAGGAGSGVDDLRRYHSLDITHVEQLLPDQQDTGVARTVSAAAAVAGEPSCESPSAPLPPLPAACSKDHGQHHQQQQEQNQGTDMDELQQLMRVGVVKHRSLDWGHKLCKPDAA